MKSKLLLSVVASAMVTSIVLADATSLGEVTVTTATKTEKAIDGVAASVIVVTQEQIEKTGAATLDKVLEKIPSLNAQYARFPHPSSKSKAAISLRGVGANGTLILIDGKRLSGETESPYEMTRIPASMIERIEIVKGSMSTLYGSDAIGGVINIITKKIDKNVTTTDLKYGMNRQGDAKNKNVNFTTRGSVDSFRYKVYASVTDTTPFTVNKAYSQQATNPSTGADNNAHALDDIAGTQAVTYKDEAMVKTVGARLENDFSDQLTAGIDMNYFTETREGQYLGNAKTTVGGLALMKNTPINSKDENRRLDISADLEYYITNDLSVDAKVYRSYYRKRNFTDPINFGGPTNTKFSANVTFDTFETNVKYALNEANFLTTGLEYRKEKRESSAINPDASSSEFITKTVNYKSLFIQDEIEFSETLNAIIGARYDYISNADNKVTFQTGVVKNLSDNTSIRANYAQGYRAPDIAELYVVSPTYNDGKRYGAEVVNAIKTTAYDLKPEKSQSFEISLSNQYNDLSSEITLFNNIIKDKIELVSYGAGAAKYYTSENLEEVDIKGAEVALGYVFTPQFDMGFNATYLNTEDKSTGKELTFTPDISAALNANYAITNDWSTNMMLRYIGRQYTNSANSDSTDEYSLVDIATQYDINDTVQVYAGIDNLFDKQIEEELGVNIGQYFYIGLRATF